MRYTLTALAAIVVALPCLVQVAAQPFESDNSHAQSGMSMTVPLLKRSNLIQSTITGAINRDRLHDHVSRIAA